jgi:outer membrane lipoprotein-sorting protein
VIIVGIAFSATAPARPKPADDPGAVLDRIDRAGAAFRSMSAKLRRVSHTAAINEDNVDSGTVLLKRGHRRDLRMLIDLTDPDPKTVAFSGHTVEIYYPKMQTVDEFDVSKFKDLLEQFFLLGFGTSRAELQASYNLRLVGPDHSRRTENRASGTDPEIKRGFAASSETRDVGGGKRLSDSAEVLRKGWRL